MKNRHTVSDASLISLPKIKNRAGNITPIQSSIEVPFDIKRIYYLYDIPGGEARGGHAHKNLQQLIVAASGSFDLVIDDGTTKRTFHMGRPDVGVYLPCGLWRELINFSSGAICLVIASELYDENDYIRSFDDFLSYVVQ